MLAAAPPFSLGVESAGSADRNGASLRDVSLQGHPLLFNNGCLILVHYSIACELLAVCSSALPPQTPLGKKEES